MKPRGIHVQMRCCPSQVESERSWLALSAGMQAHLILSYFALSHSVYTVSFKLKVCGNPALSKFMSTVSPTAFAHFLSLSHLVSLATFQTLLSLLYVMVICGH